LFGAVRLSLRTALWITVVAVAVWIVVSQVNLYPQLRFSGVPVYAHTARLVAVGALPFRDFDVEYPPLAVLLLTLPELAPAYWPYRSGFSLLMLVALCATAPGRCRYGQRARNGSRAPGGRRFGGGTPAVARRRFRPNPSRSGPAWFCCWGRSATGR
jgi:hypothetical protein